MLAPARVFAAGRRLFVEDLVEVLERLWVVRLGEPEERFLADLALAGLFSHADQIADRFAVRELGEGEDGFLADAQVRVLLDGLQDGVRGAGRVHLGQPEEGLATDFAAAVLPAGPGDRLRRPRHLALAEREDRFFADVVVWVVAGHAGEEPGAALAAHLSDPEEGVLACLARGRGRGELLQGRVRVGVAVHRQGGERLRARIVVAALAGPGEIREIGDSLLRFDVSEPDEAAAAGVQGTVLREAADLVDLSSGKAEEDVHPLIRPGLFLAVTPPALVFAFQTAGRGVEILVEAALAPEAGHHGDRVAHPERLSAAGAGLLQRCREPGR